MGKHSSGIGSHEEYGRLARWAVGLCVVLGLTSLGRASAAEAGAASAAATGGEIARLQAEVARLAQEQREQRALIFQLMQADQQRYDLLLKFLQSGGLSGTAGPVPTLPSLAAPVGNGPPSATGTAANKASGGASAPVAAAPEAVPPKAHITGRVRFEGGTPAEAYVYLEGMRVAMRPQTVEIHQKRKQFSPRVSVVPLGTRLLFPNDDPVAHNVFSPTPEQAFDLGKVQAGDKPNPVVLSKPGPLEIFCNIHPNMAADVLVVSNPHWARVGPDGAFDLADVPLGTRRIVLWGPNLRSVAERVELTAKGAAVTFNAQAQNSKPHLNKAGQAYGSYGD
jgi:plastocyanin